MSMFLFIDISEVNKIENVVKVSKVQRGKKSAASYAHRFKMSHWAIGELSIFCIFCIGIIAAEQFPHRCLYFSI